jgi:hypothetical protein
MAIIYKISFANSNKVYYGSSLRDLNKRRIEHKSRCYNQMCDAYEKKLYKYIRENKKWEDVQFDVLEEFQEITKRELHLKEKDYIRNGTNVLNQRDLMCIR